MGDLGIDTAVSQVGPGRYAATLSADWEIWGPNGGYLAAVAMRAAGAHCGRDRPASLNAHFVGAGASGPVQIEVETNRATKVATSVTVRINQGDRALLVATVWGADSDLEGLEHHTGNSIDHLPGPEGLPTMADRLAKRGMAPPHPFWANVDHRTIGWIEDWDDREPQEAAMDGWYRFVPTSRFDDPWVDAMRSLILIDLDSWPAAVYAHVGDLSHYAPTIELAVRFARPLVAEDWLLNRARVPVANGGLMLAGGEVWAADGRLVATGGSTLLCRPAARRPDGQDA